MILKWIWIVKNQILKNQFISKFNIFVLVTFLRWPIGAVQKYLSQYRNIYPSTEIFIPVQKYLSQYRNIYPSTKIFIPVQKYFSSTKLFIPVQKYFSSTKLFIPVQKYFSTTKLFFQYKTIYPSTNLFFQYKNIYPTTNVIHPTRFFPCCIAPLVKFPPKQDGRIAVEV